MPVGCGIDQATDTEPEVFTEWCNGHPGGLDATLLVDQVKVAQPGLVGFRLAGDFCFQGNRHIADAVGKQVATQQLILSHRQRFTDRFVGQANDPVVVGQKGGLLGIHGGFQSMGPLHQTGLAGTFKNIPRQYQIVPGFGNKLVNHTLLPGLTQYRVIDVAREHNTVAAGA